MERIEKKVYPCDGFVFISKEELHFYHWIKEAQQLNIIAPVPITYQPDPFILTDKQTYNIAKTNRKGLVKFEERVLFKQHTYQPDFVLYPGENYNRLRLDWIIGFTENKEIIKHAIYGKPIFIDVKGAYNQNDAYRRFSIDQKLMLLRYDVIVQKVIPQDFFLKTWAPIPAAFIANRKKPTRSAAYEKCKLVNERMTEERFFRSEAEIKQLTNSKTYLYLDFEKNKIITERNESDE